MAYFLILFATLAHGFNEKAGLSAVYKDGNIKITYKNESGQVEKIALATRSYPIFDIEQSGWFSWSRIYPQSTDIRLKKGVDRVFPGKTRSYNFKIRLDKKQKYRLFIHGFGGCHITYSN